jgi:hypothetical protein
LNPAAQKFDFSKKSNFSTLLLKTPVQQNSAIGQPNSIDPFGPEVRFSKKIGLLNPNPSS